MGVTAGIAGVTSDAQAARNISISINKLVESMTLQVTNLTEGTQQIQDQVSKALLAAINDVNNM
jgi:hypothetical protein